MGRPARFTEDAILDAALALFADRGAEAVRMTAVAAALGAPSGSIYHRFPSRGALTGALWNRTTEAFFAEMCRFLHEPAAAAHACLRWCDHHPAETALLQAGPHFVQSAWPESAVVRRDAHLEEVSRVLKQTAGRLGVSVVQLRFALVDLPTTAVRRHVPGELALRSIRALLPAPVHLHWLQAGEEARLRRVRLRALLESPACFGSEFDEVVQRSPESWTDQLAQLPTLVAVLDDRDVGMVRGVPGPSWELISLWVAPEVRGRGVGARLVEGLGKRSSQLHLSVHRSNEPARKLYARLGFEESPAPGEQLEVELRRTMI